MSVYVDTKYRIKRSAEHDEDMKYVVQDLKIVQTMSDLLVICALIGYNNHAYDEFDKNSQDGVLMQFFSQRHYDLMDLIAYAHKKSQNVLKDSEKYKIFESYANGGFPIFIKCLDVDLVQRDKNNRLSILLKYYSLLLSGGFVL